MRLIINHILILCFLFIFQFIFSGELYGAGFEKWIQQYQTGDLAKKRLALKALKRVKEKSLFAFFLEATKENDHFIRRHAFEGISQYPIEIALPVLTRSLNDPSPFVFHHSITLFKKIPGSDSIKALLPLLKKKNRQTVSSVIDTLGDIGQVKTIFKIIPFMDDSDDTVSSLAFLAIGKLVLKHRDELRKGTDSDSKFIVKQDTLNNIKRLISAFIHSFKPGMKKSNPAKQKNILWSLGVIVDILNEQLNTYILFEEEKGLRTQAEKIFNRMQTFIPHIVFIFDQEGNEIRWYAVSVLAKYRNKKALPIFVKGLKGDHYLTRIYSIEGLMGLDAWKFLPDIKSLLSDKNPFVRIKAVEAIELLGPEEAALSLIPLLKDDDNQIRWHTIKALGILGNRKSISHLRSFLQHEDATIRAVTAQSLGNLGALSARHAIMLLYYDINSVVREQVGYAFGNLGYTERTFVILTQLFLDENQYVRRAALNSMSMFLDDRKIAYSDIFDFLISALKDTDAYMRIRAASLLGNSADTKALPYLQKLLNEEKDSNVIKHAKNAVLLLSKS